MSQVPDGDPRMKPRAGRDDFYVGVPEINQALAGGRYRDVGGYLAVWLARPLSKIVDKPMPGLPRQSRAEVIEDWRADAMNRPTRPGKAGAASMIRCAMWGFLLVVGWFFWGTTLLVVQWLDLEMSWWLDPGVYFIAHWAAWMGLLAVVRIFGWMPAHNFPRSVDAAYVRALRENRRPRGWTVWLSTPTNIEIVIAGVIAYWLGPWMLSIA